MSVLALLLVLVLVGFGLYLLKLAPIDPTVLLVIRAIVILFVILWVLDAFFGVGLGSVGLHPGRVRW